MLYTSLNIETHALTLIYEARHNCKRIRRGNPVLDTTLLYSMRTNSHYGDQIDPCYPLCCDGSLVLSQKYCDCSQINETAGTICWESYSYPNRKKVFWHVYLQCNFRGYFKTISRTNIKLTSRKSFSILLNVIWHDSVKKNVFENHVIKWNLHLLVPIGLNIIRSVYVNYCTQWDKLCNQLQLPAVAIQRDVFATTPWKWQILTDVKPHETYRRKREDFNVRILDPRM